MRGAITRRRSAFRGVSREKQGDDLDRWTKLASVADVALTAVGAAKLGGGVVAEWTRWLDEARRRAAAAAIAAAGTHPYAEYLDSPAAKRMNSPTATCSSSLDYPSLFAFVLSFGHPCKQDILWTTGVGVTFTH